MNPLLSPFTGLHATAPFSQIKGDHYMPAFREAIREAREEIERITDNPAVPDFTNTIEALESSGRRLNTIRKIFFNLNSAETGDTMQQTAQEVAPLLAEFGNDVMLNEALFDRVKSVYKQRDRHGLDIEQQMLLENTYKSFIRSGANLNAPGKERYRAITGELSRLGLLFEQNVLAETNAFEMHITSEADLSGLPCFVRDAAAMAAKQKDKTGWVFTLHQPSYVAFMKYADSRPLREKMFRAYSGRGNKDDKHDNKEILRKIVSLNMEKAKLLGYPTHAAYVLERRMAGTPDKVEDFLLSLHKASRTHAEKELAEVRKYAAEHGFPDSVMRWDWPYWSEKLKKERYGFNEEELKPYFRLENVIKGVFALAERLYSLRLEENRAIEVYHPDVKAWEVFDGNGEFVAVLYMDFFPRAGKRPGAWMTDYRDQYMDDGVNVRPHVSIVANFTKPTEEEPSLLTFDEVTTFLHEFGHALHGMLSQCRYASLSGTNVFWDFVELPSQIHENWACEKEWLDMFAIHHLSGEKIPAALMDKLVAARNFQEGYATQRQLGFGLLDMACYNSDAPIEGSIDDFEKKAMAPAELLDRVDGTLMSTSFAHIFAGGYDAGYYSYKWAEVLDADAFSVFRRNGIFDRDTADSFRTNILEKGGSEHPMTLYKRFRGQEPSIDALLERSGMK